MQVQSIVRSYEKLVHAITPWVLLSLFSCANIRFEQSPYAPRKVEAVYSQQENLTFIVWRLAADADPGLVRFELWGNGKYESIDLNNTAYPAQPYRCVGGLCFQYQVEGLYRVPANTSMLRSEHVNEGLFVGPVGAVRQVVDTLSMAPIALSRNTSIDPTLSDWFVNHRVPLRRNFQYALYAFTEGSIHEVLPGCPLPPTETWESFKGEVAAFVPESQWTEDARCLALQPMRRGGDGVILKQAVIPSAELWAATEVYTPERETAPIVYLMLIDLLITSSERCQQVYARLPELIAEAFEARGPAKRIGIYGPVAQDTGVALSACQQSDTQAYPIVQIRSDIEATRVELGDVKTRIVVVYVNNTFVQPSDQVLMQLFLLNEGIADTGDIFLWGIGSGDGGPIELDDFMGWRSIEDRSFAGDITAFAKRTLPFVTVLHDITTMVPLNAPRGATLPPEAFKLCSTQPLNYLLVGSPFDDSWYTKNSQSAPWPTFGAPAYTIDLGEQWLVPWVEYKRLSIQSTIETCDRFCAHPFRDRAGLDHVSWLDVESGSGMGVCAWAL